MVPEVKKFLPKRTMFTLMQQRKTYLSMKKIVLMANYCIYIIVLAINARRRNTYIIKLQGKCVTTKMSITYENTQSSLLQ